ncbi:MAG TPA: hypothetical protein VLS52_02650 [Rudaea sp.]|nr:hypothetical protein [Rudaea sp.]
MRLFLDCEYNGFGGELISMAIVAEDGREWYEVVMCEKPGDWVAEHVMPILGKRALPDKAMLTSSLFMFLRQFDSIHVMADWPEDVAHFCVALITDAGLRIDTPPLTMEVLRIEAFSELPHNALADARGMREAVLAGWHDAEKRTNRA